MKYKGKEVKGKNQEIIPIVRPDGNIIFIAGAVKNWLEFEALVPEPKAPKRTKPGGIVVEDTQNGNYLKAVSDYGDTRTDYLVLKSLQDTVDLEWETVDMQKPSTWANWKKELRDSDFTEIEIGRITMGVMKANSLDEKMIDEARTSFLAGRQESED